MGIHAGGIDNKISICYLEFKNKSIGQTAGVRSMMENSSRKDLKK